MAVSRAAVILASMSSYRSLPFVTAALGAALAVAATPAGAATTTFKTRTITQPASAGLAVSGPLDDLVAVSRARVVVPADWRARSAPAGRLRFSVRQNPSCGYALTYSVRSALAPRQDAASYVAAALPAPGSRYLLDSGTRDGRAFRVVRQKTVGGQVRVDALWAGVLTRRADVAPSGQLAWTEIRVSARSTKGSECHAGTWRESLGPAIGDTLAVARTSLRFVKPA